MLNEYISEAVKLAKYEVLNDASIYGEIPLLKEYMQMLILSRNAERH